MFTLYCIAVCSVANCISDRVFVHIVLIQIRILDKSEKMESQEDNWGYVVIIFMNSFNAVYAFTEL